MDPANRPGEQPTVDAKGMRVVLVGSGSERFAEQLAASGFTIVEPTDSPKLVIAYGGDGTLLGADRDFPTLPKVVIRRDGEFIKCRRHRNERVLARIARGEYNIRHLPRIMANVHGTVVQGINDITFHNANAQSAVRYRVRIDGKPYSEEIVGDGLVVATPFGSAAYYRSITKSVFRVGIGLAFNNSTEAINHLVLHPNSVVEISVTRGPGIVFSDNLPEPLTVETGETFEINAADSESVLYELDTLTCMDCKVAATGNPAGFRHV